MEETNMIKCHNPECEMKFESVPVTPHPDFPEFNMTGKQFSFNIKCPKCDTMIEMITKEKK
jgi:hypothetical protein